MKKNSLQFELSLKISIFFILFIFIFSSSIIVYMSSEYNKIIISNINDNMEKTVDSIEYYFTDVKTPIVMLARNDNTLKAIRSYQKMTNKEKLETVNALNDLVQNITTFKPFINDIIIVGGNGYLFNRYDNNPDKYLNNFEFIESDYLKKIQEGSIKLYYLGQHSTEYYLNESLWTDVYSVILPIRGGKGQIGYIICDIKADTLNDILSSSLKNEKSKILIKDKEGQIIFESGNPDIKLSELSLEDINHNISMEKKGIWDILFSKGNYMTQITSKVTGWTYIYAEPFENFNGFVKKVIGVNIAIILIGLAVIVFFSKQISKQILKPLRNIAFLIQEMKINQEVEGTEKYFIKSQNVNELGIEIERMIQKMDKLINDIYVYELKAKDAQIQILVSQLSPHFLYNTLQLIEYHSYLDHKENVSRIINGLSYILRYSVNPSKIVHLEEELNYIKYYLEIYSLRFKGKLSYEIMVEDEMLTQAVIPKMILEPVVGNSLKHGFADSLKNANINITISSEDHILYIKVLDNGKGIEQSILNDLRERLSKIAIVEEHIGLNNINSIIRLRHGDEYGVIIESNWGEFTEVTLRIPLNFHMEK